MIDGLASGYWGNEHEAEQKQSIHLSCLFMTNEYVISWVEGTGDKL